MTNFLSIGVYWSYFRAWVVTHKLWTAVIAVILVASSWWLYGKLNTPTAQTKYVLGTVSNSTIISSISGSGQVSTDDTLDIKPTVSGTVTYVGVTAGQKVAAGTLIASIDDTDAQKAVRDAKANLTSAQLSLQKLVEPADTLTITQNQNSVVNASTSLQTT